MIAYADNINADYLNNIDKDALQHTLRLEFSDSTIKILSHRKCYWKRGTHYYKPLPPTLTLERLLSQARNPSAGIRVIGEVVAENQGWVGSALKTV